MPNLVKTKEPGILRNVYISFVSISSLRAKATIGVVLPLVLILSIFTAIEYLRHRALLLSNLSLFATYSAEVVQDNLRHQMLESNFDSIQQFMDTVNAREEFQTILVLDTTGKVIFAPEGQNTGLQLDNNSQDCQPCHRLLPEERPRSVVVTNAAGQRVFRSMYPLENSLACAECHDPEERLIGVILTDISMAPLTAPLAVDLRENLLWWAGTILVTILVVNLVMSRFILRRLEGLLSAIIDFGQGKLPEPALKNESDEIGQLTDSFHVMAQKIERRRQENQTLSERLQHRNV
jgi:HAMP domain-containing protein